MFPQELDAYYKSKSNPSVATPSKTTTKTTGPTESIDLGDGPRHYGITVSGKQYAVTVEET